MEQQYMELDFGIFPLCPSSPRPLTSCIDSLIDPSFFDLDELAVWTPAVTMVQGPSVDVFVPRGPESLVETRLSIQEAPPANSECCGFAHSGTPIG
jgi:hypothetical protein